MNRLFETEELGIIRDVLKKYANENFYNLTNIESNALKLIWSKVKKLHLKQKREDQELIEKFFRNS